MSNSTLAKVHYWTNNYSSRNGNKISKIIIHHMAGNLDAKGCYNVWKTREGSAHYAISSKGEIGQLIDEKYRAWSVANAAADSVAVTMELANDGGASTNWHVSDKAIAACIELCYDICLRNGIKKLNFTGDKNGNLVMHRYYMATACPGQYLAGKFNYIANEVNKKLSKGSSSSSSSSTTPAKKTETKELYRVRKTWSDAKSQVGAFNVLENAKKLADEKKLNVYDSKGKLVYSAAPKKVPVYRVRKTWSDSKSQVGAYKLLANAKKACDQHPGYSVYDESGKAVYTSKIPSTIEKLVAACKAQTEWMYKSTYAWESKPTVEKSKKKGTCVTYVACVLQRIGILKPGEYIWHDGSGYGKGKVYGTNNKMTVTYVGNKRPSELKNTLKLGDIVMIDDNKSGNKGDGGHIEIFAGTIDSNGKAMYYSGGLGSGHNTSNTHKDDRKILAIVRIK